MNLRRAFGVLVAVDLLVSPFGAAHADPCTYCRVPVSLSAE
ncbi:hypothetical protein [Deinococcus sp. KNUC1210]|nr:hypothetical protein [Deinococcus sp. KNUC1210]